MLPKCQNCKWYVPKTGKCRAFGFPNQPLEYRATLVRENVDLCGPSGFYFAPLSLQDFRENLHLLSEDPNLIVNANSLHLGVGRMTK